MNAVVKTIENLKRDISYIEFKDHLSYDDYARIKQLSKQIEELEKELAGVKGIAVHVLYKDREHYISDGWYLTDNPSLCCSDEPVLFESLEEAQSYLEKANLDLNRYDIKFEEKNY